MRMISLAKHRLWPVLFVFLAGCGAEPTGERLPVHHMTGQTMGTTYSVKVAGENLPGLTTLQDAVEAELEAVNAAMSTWLDDSDLSRFNRHDSTEPITVQPITLEVLRKSIEVAEQTGGALDPTVGPLVDLWGFGRQRETIVPTDEAIAAMRARTGYRKLRLGENTLAKDDPAIELNLNANAKGFAIDQVAAMLRDKGYTNFMVEVGGEIVTIGDGPSQQGWRLAIADPKGGLSNAFYMVIDPLGKAMATAGNYRNFFVLDGVTYHHIIDPRTGRPARDLVSAATVMAPDCNTADALATALMVMTPDDGLALIESLPGVECLLLLKPETEDGPFRERKSSGFAAHQLQ